MNLKELFGFWLNLSFIVKNDPTDPTVDRFVRQLIEHKDEVRFLRSNGHTVTVAFRGKRFTLWVSNYPYAYLSDIWLDDGSILGKRISSHLMPSRKTVFDFHEAFDAEIKAKIFESTNKLSVLRAVIDEKERA